MISLTEKQTKAEEREFRKLEKMIARKDTKALNRWTKKWLSETRREEKKYNKETKKGCF